LLASAAAEGIPGEVITAFVDPELEALLGIDGDHEAMVALVGLGAGANDPPTSPEVTALPFESIPLSSREVDYDDLRKIQRESRLVTIDEVASIADAPIAIALALAPSDLLRFESSDECLGLGQTILRRGSTRTFAHEALEAAELQTIMDVSISPLGADFPPLVDAYLIVNAVNGMTAGNYYYDRVARGYVMLREGSFRAEAGYLCLEQMLGADCSVLLVYMADLERALAALGNRGYRDAHLEAGIIGGRAYLAAYSLGRGATGLTFYDDDTTKFFEPHAARKSPILMVALGVPAGSSAS
jgi:SagB-type dehydrogenase family enzyme